MIEINQLIGLTIVDIRGFNSTGSKKKGQYILPQYILFADEETLIELEEQDYYAYHDCASSARHICIFKNKTKWKDIYYDKKHFPKANMDI